MKGNCAAEKTATEWMKRMGKKNEREKNLLLHSNSDSSTSTEYYWVRVCIESEKRNHVYREWVRRTSSMKCEMRVHVANDDIWREENQMTKLLIIIRIDWHPHSVLFIIIITARRFRYEERTRRNFVDIFDSNWHSCCSLGGKEWVGEGWVVVDVVDACLYSGTLYIDMLSTADATNNNNHNRESPHDNLLSFIGT